MKKYILGFAVIILTTVSAHAQFSLGAKAGVNFSKINTDNLDESIIAGYQAGLFARVGKSLFIQPELYLSSTGGKFDSNDNGTAYNGKVRFTNLNVPLLIGKYFGGQNLNIHIMAGPVYTYVLDKNASFSDNFNQAYHDFGDYNNSTLGFQAGAGLDLGHITADLRYEGGLTKINDNYGQRQNIWSLSVGFKFF
ncbi:porin family protein [Mucilaginibacter segetis]|uniref:PorT family protein n=1 Tax=Mucilaginibacter segetis TaxID=2793071 RepID=A0A934UNP8_9SPHI|nr:porin family protein [Mucilaginibacter segetis]MBK0380121.1 PorT family protein [Mucilaginibacter segetis]